MLQCLTVLPSSGQALSRAWLQHVDYRLCRTVDELRAYVQPALEAGTPVGCDWEATSLNVWTAAPVGLCLSVAPGTGVYAPIGHQVGFEKNLPVFEVFQVLKDLADRCETIWAYYRFDGSLMRRFFRWEPTRWRDITLGAFLEYSDAKSFGLKPTALRLLGIEMIEYEEATESTKTTKADSGGFHLLDPEEGYIYASQDADFTRRIYFHPKIQAAIRQQPSIWDIEHKIIKPVRTGIDAGCWLDPGHLLNLRAEVGGCKKVKGKYTGEFTGKLKVLRDRIYQRLGESPETFNIDSRPQLGPKLVALGVPIVEETDGGKVATGKDVLEKYRAAHPVVDDLIQYGELGAQDRNYIAKLLLAYQHLGPLVRFPFNTIGAPTGRMSAGGEGTAAKAYAKGYVDLNLQSTPAPGKEKYLPNIRKALVANDPRVDSDEWVIVGIDYSQIELRCAANLSRERTWIEAFIRGEDIHKVNAQFAYNDPTITKDDPRRSLGKTMSFAMLFQATAETVASHGRISVTRAKELLDNFIGHVPRLSAWIDLQKQLAETQGFVKTHFGRRRYLRQYFQPGMPRSVRSQGHREAVNMPVQGTAADIFKIGVIRVDQLLDEQPTLREVFVPFAWIHDELVARCKRKYVEEVVPQIVARLEFQVKGWEGLAPIKADAEVGWNWGETSSSFTSRYNLQADQLVSWLAPRERFQLPEDLGGPKPVTALVLGEQTV